MKKQRTPTNGASKLETDEGLVRRDAWIVRRLIIDAFKDPKGEAARRLRAVAIKAAKPAPLEKLPSGAYLWKAPVPSGTRPRSTKAEKRADLRAMLEWVLNENDHDEPWRSAVAVFDEWALAYLTDPLWPEEDFRRGHDGQLPRLRFLACIYLALPQALQVLEPLARRVLANEDEPGDVRTLESALSIAWPKARVKSKEIANAMADWWMLRAAEALGEKPDSFTQAERSKRRRTRRA